MTRPVAATPDYSPGIHGMAEASTETGEWPVHRFPRGQNGTNTNRPDSRTNHLAELAVLGRSSAKNTQSLAIGAFHDRSTKKILK